MMLHPELNNSNTRPVPEVQDEIRLFCVVQNEALRLPAFFAHYRKLGASRFFVIDNHSTDETAAFLAAQPDAHVFYTAGSFAAAHSGIDWVNSLLNVYGIGHWCVIADADELLVYPDCEIRVLPEFCAELGRSGARAMQTIMLDMYSDQPMTKLAYQAGQDLLAACPYFDRDYQFVPRLGLPVCQPFPPTEPLGGPRARLFFPKQYHATPLQRLWAKILFRALKPLADYGWLAGQYVPHPAPQMFKIPLIHWQSGDTMITNHRVNRMPLATTTGALLHFKYLQDFSNRMIAAITHGQHYHGSSEYQYYGALLQKNPNITFMYEGSTRYHSSADLLAAGLMRR